MIKKTGTAHSIKVRTAKLRNPRLLQITQSKSPYFERDEPDIV